MGFGFPFKTDLIRFPPEPQHSYCFFGKKRLQCVQMAVRLLGVPKRPVAIVYTGRNPLSFPAVLPIGTAGATGKGENRHEKMGTFGDRRHAVHHASDRVRGQEQHRQP